MARFNNNVCLFDCLCGIVVSSGSCIKAKNNDKETCNSCLPNPPPTDFLFLHPGERQLWIHWSYSSPECIIYSVKLYAGVCGYVCERECVCVWVDWFLPSSQFISHWLHSLWIKLYLFPVLTGVPAPKASLQTNELHWCHCVAEGKQCHQRWWNILWVWWCA